MKHQTFIAFTAASALAFTLACSGQPGAPTSPTSLDPSGSQANADGSTLKVTAPVGVSPTGGIEIDDTSPDLVINNSTGKFVQNLALTYVFEVLDAQNRVAYRSNPVAQGGGGRTTHEVDLNLDPDGSYTWRAHPVFQAQLGPRMAVASFKTRNRFGTSCRGTEAQIVACRKEQYGHIPHDLLHEFLERVAYDLNRGGHEHAPYGRLVKNTGSNCHGYSCDIICSDANGGQRQWDVLIDEDSLQAPVWNRVSEIAVRPCEPVR